MKRSMLSVGKRMSKTVHFSGMEVKQETVNGVPVGIIEGYASTWDIDRGDDIIQLGAFSRSLAEMKACGRPIRMLFGHDYENIIGAFPCMECYEDDRGLFVKGEINLTQGQLGEWVYSLAKQGVLSDMSIGFSIPSMDAIEFRDMGDKVIRVIKELDLWEISIVGEPMNAAAKITAVKAAAPFKDLPLAARDMEWDSDNALARIRNLTGSMEEPSATYRNAFLWFDNSATENYGSYKLPIADVVNGEMTAVPRAIFAAAAALQGARGGVNIPESDRDGVIQSIERYYAKMDIPSPFQKDYGIDTTFAESCQTIKDVEELLKYSGFSSQARKVLISLIKNSTVRDGTGDEEGDTDDGEAKARAEAVAVMAKSLKDFNDKFAATTLLNQFTK